MGFEQPSLELGISYVDDDLIEIDCKVVLGYWSAKAQSYASANRLFNEAVSLKNWILCMDTPFVVEFGDPEAIGWCSLRFHMVDKSGHLLCHVQFATRSPLSCSHREPWRFSVEMPTEPGLVEQFGFELAAICKEQAGVATLRGVLSR